MIILKWVGSICSDLLGSICSGQVGSISSGQVGSVSLNFTLYTINFKGLQNFTSIGCFTFEDKLTHTFVDLKNDSTYSFTSLIDTVNAYHRFVLHFGVENIAPLFTPSATTVSIPGNSTVQFTNTSIGASNFVWDFGDGSALDSSFSPSHTYALAGTYTASLTASNNANCSANSTILITVEDVTGINKNVAAESVLIEKNEQGILANYNFSNSTKITVKIYTAQGAQIGMSKEILVKNKGKVNILTDQLAQGIYMVECSYGNNKTTQKIQY